MENGYRQILFVCVWTSYSVVLVINGFYGCASAAQVGDIRLADGSKPNMGRVETYLGERGWFTTCDPTWDIKDAMVVCRQLGFPGAAFARATGTYRAIGIPLARKVKCTGYEERLRDCPYHTTQLCTSAVGVVCQEPSYVGCYADDPATSMFHAGHDSGPSMDLATCKAFCKTNKALYMGLKNSQDCHCGRSGVPLGQPTHEKVKDSECQMACVGNEDESCGGVSSKGNYVVSVHATNVHCRRLFNPENGYLLDTEYSFGQVVRFKCNRGYSLVGSPALICDLNKGRGRGKVAWNTTEPTCVVTPVTSDNRVWLPTRGTTGSNPAEYETDIIYSSLTSSSPTSETSLSLTFKYKGNAKATLTKVLADRPGIILVISLMVVLLFCGPVVIFILMRRKLARRKVVADAKSDRPYQDLLYNPSYEIGSENYQPLRPPRKRDALRKQQEEQQQQGKTKTAPGGLNMPDDPYSAWHQQDFGALREPGHNSMHNLMYIGGRQQSARVMGKQVPISNYGKQHRISRDSGHDSVYSNANTINFQKRHATRSFREESARNLRNAELTRYIEREDDESHYAVI